MPDSKQINVRKLLRVLVAAGVGLAGLAGTARAEEQAATPAANADDAKAKEQAEAKRKQKEKEEKEKKEQEKKAAEAKKAAESGGGGVQGW